MINSLSIRNFKGLDKFDLQDISRINLLGGKNNAGKTTILEALFMFYDRLNPNMILRQYNYNDMLSLRENVMRMFAGVDKNNIDALVRVIEPEDKRAEFEVAYKKFVGAVETLMPGNVSKDILNDVKWLSYIRAAAKMRYNPEKKLDISDCGEKVKEIISKYLESSGVIQWISPITLFENDFMKKIESKMSDEAIASSMEHAAKNVISIKMDENPVYYTSLFEKLMQILEETRNDWVEKKARLKDFIDREIKGGEEDVASELGLNKKEFAIFETLRDALQDKDTSGNIAKEEETEYMPDMMISFAKEFAKEFNKNMLDNWHMTGWSENSTKISQVENKIYMFLLGKSQRIREVYDKDTIAKIKELKEQMVKLAKIHYATLE